VATLGQALTSRLNRYLPTPKRSADAWFETRDLSGSWAWVRLRPDGYWCKARVPTEMVEPLTKTPNSKIVSVEIDPALGNTITGVSFDGGA
jgi:hypothetical protein